MNQADGVKKEVDSATRWAESAIRTLEQLKTPYHHIPDVPSPFFFELYEKFEEKMKRLRQAIVDIEKFMESNKQQRQFSPQSTFFRILPFLYF